ncbi:MULTISPECIES: hypothetical protein [unclassified Crossiella]|uniref:hypothetical protein n=1 Tax=unclassified Crossiella TaxID=2620835 RepID=UPI001FFEEA9E|nr:MULTISPECIES: hypothetical protein [unclassified Crossiella]MCK2237986.1 hypothetical protein [Crossiella sp. S99.2]MCK2255269.1 hypothetical protein [Crossiella sp. S99.1]
MTEQTTPPSGYVPPSAVTVSRVPGAGAVTESPAGTTVTGDYGQQLTVSKTKGLDESGASVTVTGQGYRVDKGIYVAFCVDNGPGKQPGPCGGGADMSGASGSSQWISNNPPSYGKDLAKPFGPDGTFTAQLKISPVLSAEPKIDCRDSGVKCALVSRTDHTRTADRTQDVVVPVKFGPEPAPVTETVVTPQSSSTMPIVLVGLGVVVALVAVVLVIRLLRKRSAA